MESSAIEIRRSNLSYRMKNLWSVFGETVQTLGIIEAKQTFKTNKALKMINKKISRSIVKFQSTSTFVLLRKSVWPKNMSHFLSWAEYYFLIIFITIGTWQYTEVVKPLFKKKTQNFNSNNSEIIWQSCCVKPWKNFNVSL